MSTNSKEIPGEQTSAELVIAVQNYRPKPDERNDQHFNPVSPGRHLDVDAVLARSLPKVAGE